MNGKSTRDKVLYTLLNHPRATINDIADAVGINNISVRHHLTSLQAENLVECVEERHGIGRPRLVYSLTDQGSEKFPTNYMRLATRILAQMKNSLPPNVVEQMFNSIATEMSTEHQEEARQLTLEGKLNLITRVLESEGFTVNWEKTSDGYIIQESSCPYYHVGQDHPEVCNVDMTMISNLLSVPVEKTGCVLGGSSQCTYFIKNSESVETKSL